MIVSDDLGSISGDVDCCPSICPEKMKRTATVRIRIFVAGT